MADLKRLGETMHRLPLKLRLLLAVLAAPCHADDAYTLRDGIASVAVVYELPMEELEQRLLKRLSMLPDLQPTNPRVELKNIPEGDQSKSVLNVPTGIIAKEALLGWMPDPKKMSSIKGAWDKNLIRRSTLFITIGHSRADPSRSFLILAREWSVKGGSSIPRTSISLPFKLWTRWPQLLKTDIAFLEGLGDGASISTIEGASIFDPRLFKALDWKKRK